LHTGFGSDQVMRGIRTDVSLAEAFGDRRPLRQFRMNSRAVDDFRVLADDVTRRFNLS
jgi:chromosome partitioning protein